MGKRNSQFKTYNRFQFYDIIYDQNAQAFRIGLGYDNIPTFEKNVLDAYYTIEAKVAHRLDLISLEVYGTDKLWWVIAMANEMQHPIKDATPGTVLRIPDARYVKPEV